MAELVDQLEKEWDMVLLDSPPIVAVTDASMVSQEIDAMVMVVKAAETDRDAFRRAVKSLTGIKVPLAGVVVNGISRRTSKDTYYYYYQYYQHYYGGYYGYYGKAKDEEVSYAVTVITLFGMIAMCVYPFLSHFLFEGNSTLAGYFLGTAIHDTAQVAGAGLMYEICLLYTSDAADE